MRTARSIVPTVIVARVGARHRDARARERSRVGTLTRDDASPPASARACAGARARDVGARSSTIARGWTFFSLSQDPSDYAVES